LAIASTKLDRHLAEQAENEAVHQNNPPTRSTLASLAFADHMDRLVAGDRTPSSPKRAKMLAGVNPALDRPVILFKDIVEVLHRSMSAVPLQSSLGLELHDGWRITGVLVGVDYPRRRMVRSAQRFGEKALGRRRIAFGREKEVDRRPGGVSPQRGINTATYP